MKFKDLELSNELLTSVERAGFEEATPIKKQQFPLRCKEEMSSVKHRPVPEKQQHSACQCWKKSTQQITNYKD